MSSSPTGIKHRNFSSSSQQECYLEVGGQAAHATITVFLSHKQWPHGSGMLALVRKTVIIHFSIRYFHAAGFLDCRIAATTIPNQPDLTPIKSGKLGQLEHIHSSGSRKTAMTRPRYVMSRCNQSTKVAFHSYDR